MNKIRGNTKTCFADWIKALPPKGSKGAATAKKPAAEFIGVSVDTVTTWTSGRCMPIGLQLIKLQFFLEVMGYEVDEMVKLQKAPLFYNFAEMLAFGVLTVGDALRELDFVHSNSIYRLVSGESDTTEDKRAKISALWESKKAPVEERRSEWQKRLSPKPVDVRPPEPRPTTDMISIRREDFLNVVGHHILTILPLVERAASDECSEEDRRVLRTLTTHENMSRTSRALQKLCGETARKQIIGRET